jgi:superfamily II DNA helicase RecQ
LSIVERTKQVPHKPTAEELQQAKKYSWMSYPKYDYIKSGELSIKLAGSGCESVISDTSRRLLESCLNEVIIRMVKLAKRIQNDREEKERREREYEEKKQRRNQIIQQHEDEKAKLEQLYSESKQWQKSQQLRAYIEAVKQAAMKNDGQIEPGSEIDKWISWAHKQADRLDPFIESPHSILDEKVPSLW